MAPPDASIDSSAPDRPPGRMAERVSEALAFDDVLVVPAYSQILPTSTDTRTKLTRGIGLNIPLISAAMDTVTETAMAIAMAQHGGIGTIHKNLDVAEQAEQVRRVKKFESGMVVNPLTIHPDQTLADARALMAAHRISGVPVVERETNRLVGILTHRDVRFATDPSVKIYELMTRENLVTVTYDVGTEEARRLLHRHRIEKLLVVDEAYRCVGLITVKDMDKAEAHPLANKDELGRLRVAAATGVGEDGHARTQALVEAGVDVVVVDTAHGHSAGVLAAVERIKRLSNAVQVIAGNVATPEGALALIRAGADAVKIGIGPGEHLHHADRGRGRRAAVHRGAGNRGGLPGAWRARHRRRRRADQRRHREGDRRRRRCGDDRLVAARGPRKRPGEVFLYQGRSYKSYRGMGSIGAMARGSADRYFPAGHQGHVEAGTRGHRGPGRLQGASLGGAAPTGRRFAGGHGLHGKRRPRAPPAERALPTHHRGGSAREPCA